MITSSISCTIERRLLVNYRIEPEFVRPLLPAPFRPQIVSGYAVGGTCFIRLAHVRPAGVPKFFGLNTENVAHRFAVEWEDTDGTHVGVYVPRRDTDSFITWAGGGRVFPGSYHAAEFKSNETQDSVAIEVESRDRRIYIAVEAVETRALESALFRRTEDAVTFFRQGVVGYSPDAHSGSLSGVRLESTRWAARPMGIRQASSTLFDDSTMFPPSTCEVDSALIMRNLPARWLTEPAPSGSLSRNVS